MALRNRILGMVVLYRKSPSHLFRPTQFAATVSSASSRRSFSVDSPAKTEIAAAAAAAAAATTAQAQQQRGGHGGSKRPLSQEEKKAIIASAWNSSAEAYVNSYQAGMEGILSPGMSAGYKLAARFVRDVANKRCEAPIIPGYEMCKGRATHGHPHAEATACDLHKAEGMVQIKDSETPVVLDVASAGGEPALTIAKIVPRAKIHATDVAPAMVEHIRKRMAQAGVTNVEAGIADGESLHAFDDGSVDVVTCTWGLMLMPNWKQALKEFARVLRSDGTVMVTLWEKDPDSIFRRMGNVLETLSPGFKGLVDPEALGDDSGMEAASEMNSIGLHDVSVSKFSVPVMLPAGSGLRQIWETCALSTPLEQTLSTMEARGRENVREEAFQIFETQMQKDWAAGKSPLGLPAPADRIPTTHGLASRPIFGDHSSQVFFVRALALVGRKKHG